MQNVALLYYTIKKIQRFEDREIWRVYGRFSRAITPFFSPGNHQIVEFWSLCMKVDSKQKCPDGVRRGGRDKERGQG